LKLFALIAHDELFVRDRQQHSLEVSPVRVKPENGTQLILPEAGLISVVSVFYIVRSIALMAALAAPDCGANPITYSHVSAIRRGRIREEI
jgi:hypothetical protein